MNEERSQSEVRNETAAAQTRRGGAAGLLLALICGFFYLGFGTRWTFSPHPSLYVHHTLTANAWLHGRTHVTAGEIQRQYMINTLLRAGQDVPRHWVHATQVRFERLQAEHFRALGVPEKEIQAEITGSLRRAFIDWVHKDGWYYAYWPPVPTALFVPLVLLFGTNFSDVVVANVLGAVTVFLVYWMLVGVRRLWPGLTPRACFWLAIFYGLGTCHMYQASVGQVWPVTQLTATMFLVLAVGLAIRGLPPVAGARGSDAAGREPPTGKFEIRNSKFEDIDLRGPRDSESSNVSWYFLWAAIALGLGFLSRNTIVLAAPFFAVLLWKACKNTPNPVRSFVRRGAVCCLILALAAGVQLVFNYVRFENALDFGQGRLADKGGNDLFAAEFHEFGRFNLHYLSRNIWYYFLNPTIREYPAYDPAQAGWTFDPMGNSLFLVSPVFLYIFLSGRKGNPNPRWLLWAVVAGAAGGLTALMLFHGTGWYQFGQRYLLDVLPFFLLLAALGMRGRTSRVCLTLICVSVVIHAWGTHRFILEQG